MLSKTLTRFITLKARLFTTSVINRDNVERVLTNTKGNFKKIKTQLREL